MVEKPPISVFIIAKDEADRIGKAIDSVKPVAAEIYVIDSGSSDDTCAIAEDHGATVVFNEWRGYGEQKRFGESLCTNDWLMNIDADERLSVPLIDEIRALELGKGADGYRLLIRDRFPFEAVPKPSAYTYNPIRLYNRHKGEYSDAFVHDSVLMKSDAIVRTLTELVYHDSQRSLAFTVDKMNRYSSDQAAVLKAQNRRPGVLRTLFEFPLNFFKAYFGRRYWRYGLWGFIVSMNYAYSRFLRLAKWHERRLLDELGEQDR